MLKMYDEKLKTLNKYLIFVHRSLEKKRKKLKLLRIVFFNYLLLKILF